MGSSFHEAVGLGELDLHEVRVDTGQHLLVFLGNGDVDVGGAVCEVTAQVGLVGGLVGRSSRWVRTKPAR